jgi:hypothetical protein
VDRTRDRIDKFIWKIAASGYDSVQVNTIGLGFGRIKRDLTYLEIAATDYQHAAADVIAASNAVWQGDFEPGTRKMTPDEIALQDERIRLSHVLGLRIDTQYFVAQRLLDSVASAADTVLSPPRGHPRGVKDLARHRTARRVLEERIRSEMAPPAQASLFAAIEEVAPVKDYRDDYVAHVDPPTFPERRPVLRIGLDRHDVMTSGSGAKTSDGVPEVMLRYVNAWLDYLETLSLPFDWPTVTTEEAD